MKKIYDNNGNLFAELNHSKDYFYNYSKHSHETFALSIIEEGEIEIQFHSQEKLYLHANKIVVFNPNQVHITKSAIKENLNYYTLHVDTKYCKNKQTNIFGKSDSFIDVENIIDDKVLYQRLLGVFEDIILNKQNIKSEQLAILVDEILEKYTKSNSIEVINEEENKLLSNIEQYIIQNIKNPITLEDIALNVRYNESYITRVFKKKYGLTPHAFLVNKRIEKARNKMLNNKEISLAQLSSEVGFYDQSHFSKVFKRVFAISPNKYRLD